MGYDVYDRFIFTGRFVNSVDNMRKVNFTWENTMLVSELYIWVSSEILWNSHKHSRKNNFSRSAHATHFTNNNN